MNKAIQEYAEAYAVYWALGEPEEGKERDRFLEAQAALEAAQDITHESIRADQGSVMQEKIIKFLTEREAGEMTYVIANVIGFRGNASPVRRQLERMMRAGLVEHATGNIYARQIKWRLKRAAAQKGTP